MEGTRRGPAGLDIGIIKSVKHGPEDIALGAKSGVGGVLFLASARVFDDPGQSEVGVFGCLREAAREVVEAGGKPRVKLAEPFHAERDEAPREKFGEGRGHSFQMRPCGDELDVGVNGIARGRQNSFAAHRVDARQAGGFDQFEPLFDTAGTGVSAVAVVIDQAFAPRGAERGVIGAGEQGGVLARDVRLIVVAVEGPSLELAAAERAFVHQLMKRVLVVIALLADGVEAGDELFFGKWMAFLLVAHSVNSMPSEAISKPASRTARCSSEVASRMGLVLLMCTRTLRAAESPGNCASRPSRPASGRWPISRAVFWPRPVERSSSSDQKVPSRKATLLEAAALSHSPEMSGSEGAKKKDLAPCSKRSAMTDSSDGRERRRSLLRKSGKLPPTATGEQRKVGGAEGSSPKRQARRPPGLSACHRTGGSARWRTSKMRFSVCTIFWMAGVAKRKKDWNSRR